MTAPALASNTYKNQIRDIAHANVMTIGVGARYSSITDAFTDNTGRGLAVRNPIEKPVSVIGPVLIGTGTDWKKAGLDPRGDENMAVGDLISIESGGVWSRWYKIKTVSSDTGAVLYENGPASGSAYRLARLVPKTFLLVPGEYAESDIPFEPGLNLIGADKNACILSEDSSGSPFPIGSYGENLIANMTLGATLAWGSLESMAGVATYPDLWAGARLNLKDVRVVQGDYDGTHAGGITSWPMLPNGNTLYDGCEFYVAGTMRSGQPIQTGVPADTRVMFKHTYFERVDDIVSAAITEPSLLIVPQNCIVDLFGCVMDIPTTTINPASASTFCRVGAGPLGSAANSILNIDSTRMYAQADDVVGIEAETDSAVVNIRNSSIECAGAATKGIQALGTDVNVTNSDVEAVQAITCEHASSTVNVRAATRAKGSTNSLLQTAGTVNKGSFVSSIGAESGTITAADT